MSYGDELAKVNLKALDKPRKRPGKPRLILVSATTPTAAGEGKTTTSIGLAQALDSLGESVCLALREPSLGPCLGIKGGATHGESDEWSYKAVDPLYCYDVHATVLHLLGIDHERLTFRHNGIDRRLTDVHGHVIEGIVA